MTLDPDVAQRLEQEARQQGKTPSAVVNETLRAGLGLLGGTRDAEPFGVDPHSFGFRPDIDLDRMNQLVDELEASEVLRKFRK
ncbi:MAG: hypothetical protein JF614_28265 [Acidobacteria bacterium]|nr:hypothetical protein [Acidobacteriota bacterium]